MKRIYFVRHGETLANVAGTVQGLDDPLTEVGEQQARRVGERAKGIDFDALIASDAVRTQQTAEAIREAKGMATVELSPLFREAKRPTSLIGMTWDTDAYNNFKKLEMEHWGESGWRFEDEENCDDLRQRAHDAIQYIEAHEKDTLMVVSHGRFLRYLIAEVMLGEANTAEVMWRIDQTLRTMNTGISVCYQTEEGGAMGWKILTWNDHAHFAD
jgi:2,3-bisphosphoglycerate-dependent phosphoglycerate mutase